jgi:hypothetical protein
VNLIPFPETCPEAILARDAVDFDQTKGGHHTNLDRA